MTVGAIVATVNQQCRVYASCIRNRLAATIEITKLNLVLWKWWVRALNISVMHFVIPIWLGVTVDVKVGHVTPIL